MPLCVLRVSVALTVAAWLAWPTAALAQIFVYTDARGHVHFTDTPRHTGYARLDLSPQRPHGPQFHPRGPTDAWDGPIQRASRKHGLHPALVKAVIHSESGFDPRAVSRAGAVGLMQLMPATAKELGVTDSLNPWQNIEAGARYLGYLVKQYPGNLSYALAAYNAGPANVRRYAGVPPFKETRTYIERVKRLYRHYHADFH